MAREATTSGESVVRGQVTRREALAGVGAVLGAAAVMRELPGRAAAPRPAPAQSAPAPAEQAEAIGPYDPSWLPDGVRSRFVHNVNGLTMHVLEAGFETAGRPALLLLHGFPELAYSWRHVMAPLADAGYHVIAPGSARLRAHDGLERRLRRQPAAVQPAERRARRAGAGLGLRVPHGGRGDRPRLRLSGRRLVGGRAAGRLRRRRPDERPVRRHAGVPVRHRGRRPAGRNPRDRVRTSTRRWPACPARGSTTSATTARARRTRTCGARPRGSTTSCAPTTTTRAPTGPRTDRTGWPDGPRPRSPRCRRTTSWTSTWAWPRRWRCTCPRRPRSPPTEWLPDRELHVYAVEYERNGFQGGLQWYRSGGVITDEPLTFAGRTIDIPSLFIAGSSDWGAYQRPGSLERMQETACTDMRGVHFVDGAGHWVQQEQPEETVRLLLEFLREA